MKMTAFKMPTKLIARIEAEAERSGATKSEIVRRAIDEYLERRERQGLVMVGGKTHKEIENNE